MTTAIDKLTAAAAEAMRLNDGNSTKAAPKLARMLIENSQRPLLVALCTDFLDRLPPIAAVVKLMPAVVKADSPPPKPAATHRRVAVLKTRSAQAKAGEIAASNAAAEVIFNRKIRGAGPLGKRGEGPRRGGQKP
jgi:hypothetical protein